MKPVSQQEAMNQEVQRLLEQDTRQHGWLT